MHRFDVTNRPEALARVAADPSIELRDLLVRKSRVRLRDRDELAVVPHAEGVIGKQARALAAARLRVDEDGVDRKGIDLPLPLVAAFAAHAVRRVEALQHETLDAAGAGFGAQNGEVVPSRRVNDRRRAQNARPRRG